MLEEWKAIMLMPRSLHRGDYVGAGVRSNPEQKATPRTKLLVGCPGPSLNSVLHRFHCWNVPNSMQPRNNFWRRPAIEDQSPLNQKAIIPRTSNTVSWLAITCASTCINARPADPRPCTPWFLTRGVDDSSRVCPDYESTLVMLLTYWESLLSCFILFWLCNLGFDGL
jgi:hypothetical protein